jgi:hypothetical protein
LLNTLLRCALNCRFSETSMRPDKFT